jgi:hypothetical protein
MNALNVTNVLDQREALITITVLPGAPRAARPVVVTVGVPEERVAMRAGQFGQIARLIDEAWGSYTEFAVGDAAAPVPMPLVEDEAELLDEEAVETAVAPAAQPPNPAPSFYGDDLL